MNRILLLSTLLAFCGGPSAQAQITTFSANGSTQDAGTVQTYTVPAGVTRVTITATGGSGGGTSLNNRPGGNGASMSARVAVTPGETLQILVGKSGSGATYGAAGGGGSFVTRTSFTTANLLVAAGGGGGANFNTNGSGSTVRTSSGTAPGAVANGTTGAALSGGASPATGGTGGGNGGSNGQTTSVGGYGGGGALGRSVTTGTTLNAAGGGGGGGGFSGGNGGNGQYTNNTTLGGGGGGGGAFGGTAGTGGTNGVGSSSTPGSAGTSWVVSTATLVTFTPNTNTGNGVVTISTAIPLPLSLLHFEAQSAGAHNQLNWSTATEDPGTVFEVERSADGNNFEKIATLAGKGATATYSALDKTPLEGISYYRLNIIEPAGERSYSKVAIVRRSSNLAGGISVWPVPAGNTVTIATTNAALFGSTVTALDLQGRIMATATVSASTQMEVQNWPAGMYTLKFEDGTAMKMVKQ